MISGSTADVLIIGAGPAGLTLARLVALKGRKVVVIAPASAPLRRLELLTPPSLGVMAATGLEPLLHDPAMSRSCLGIRRNHATPDCEYDDFLRHPRGRGYVVDRARFDERLRLAALAAGVAFYRARVTGMARGGRELRVQLSDGPATSMTFTGPIVDATGRAAAIARRKGAKVIMRDRRIAELIDQTIDASPDAAGWLDYKSEGASWSYCIRGPGGQAQTWRVRRSGKAASGALVRSDASARVLSEAAGEDWIAIGDAAVAFDPIASQGLFNALSSALVVAGMLMSTEGLSTAAGRLYSDAVAATFMHSESGRAAVYRRTTPYALVEVR